MFRKILVIVVVTAISIFCLNGCKKRADEVKTAAEYETEAKDQINKDNMAKELESIEKALEQDISQEQ